MFLLASAFVGFQGWPAVAGQSAPVSVVVPRADVGAGSKASRVLSSAATAPVAGVAAGRVGHRTTAAVTGSRSSRGRAAGGSAPATGRTTLVSHNTGLTHTHTGTTTPTTSCTSGCGHGSHGGSSGGSVGGTVKHTASGAGSTVGSTVGKVVTTVTKTVPVQKAANGTGTTVSHVVTTVTHVVKSLTGGVTKHLTGGL
jgi:hypothetical protein